MEESIMQTVRAIAPFAQIVVGITALLISTGVAAWVARRNREAADVQYWRSVRESWIDVEKFTLSSDENLQLVDSLLYPDLAAQSMEDRRKRWIGHMVLTLYVSLYFGTRIPDLHTKEGHHEQVKSDLRPMMRDDVLYDLAQSRAYGRTFQNLARELREEQGLAARSEP